MRESPEEKEPITVFAGSDLGPFTLGETLIYYDEPQVFLIHHGNGGTWVAMAEGDLQLGAESFLVTSLAGFPADFPGKDVKEILETFRTAARANGCWRIYENLISGESVAVSSRKLARLELEQAIP